MSLKYFTAFLLICIAQNIEVECEVVFNCTEKGMVALTFDDGPSFPETLQVLGILKEFGVHATFFINGLYNYESDLERYKQSIKRIFDEGHQLGSHNWNHVNLTSLPSNELKADLEHLAQLVRQTVSVNMTLLRPPYGEFNGGVESLAKREFGYDIVLWNVDTRDWDANYDGLEAYRDFYSGENNNSSCISLHHDPLPRSGNLTRDTLNYLINDKGLKVVTVAECIGKPMYVKVTENASFKVTSNGVVLILALWVLYQMCVKC